MNLSADGQKNSRSESEERDIAAKTAYVVEFPRILRQDSEGSFESEESSESKHAFVEGHNRGASRTIGRVGLRKSRRPPYNPKFYAPNPPYDLNHPQLIRRPPYDITRDRASGIYATLDSHWRRRQLEAFQRGIVRNIKLTKGHFIAEYPVPTAVKNAIEPQYASKFTTEFSHVRYTACTADPDDFTEENGWSLRTKLYNRETEILIAVTSYNECKKLYARTLHGIMLNIRDICRTRQSTFWRRDTEDGLPNWQKITVALIVDGLDAMDKSVLDILATIGVYQDGVMKKQVDGRDTVAHIFEYTTQLSVDATPRLVLPQANNPNNLVPCQIILIVKAQNQRKINSHRWLFNAIGRMLKPEICLLIDAGTKPGYKSIFYLWEAFWNDKNLGGCAGEIHAMLNGGKKLFNPLVAAQNFEYKMSNILDKPLESSFGYVSVLPGAFSAYRYRAIQGRPLEQYFHGDPSLADRLGDKGIKGMSIFRKNMFLAEDRILCFELFAKDGEKWKLTYVKHSRAETDVPEAAAELIAQRRRWLNGSFAASVYALVNFWRIYQSGHGFVRLFFFHIQSLFNALSLIFTWFSLANLWLTFSIIIDFLPSQGIVITGNINIVHWFNQSMTWIYITFLVLQFVLALGNRPKGERTAYTVTLWIYALLSAYLLTCSLWLTYISLRGIYQAIESKEAIWLIILTPPLGPLMAAILATFGVYFFSSLLFCDIWHMFHSFIPYLLLAPSFVNVLNVYAFCNLHDVSWGTKGSDRTEALPSVKSKIHGAGAPTVEDKANSQEDLDEAFQETVTRALTKDQLETRLKNLYNRPTMDDENRTFRTRLVASWMLTNAALAIAISNIGGWLNIEDPDITRRSVAEWLDQHSRKRNMYFMVLLYSAFLLSFVRFMGCLYYWAKLRLARGFRWVFRLN